MENNLRARLETHRINAHHTIWFVVSMLCALAVTNKKKFTHLWTPIDRSDASLDLLVGLEHKRLCYLIPLAGQHLRRIIVFFLEEVSSDIKFMIKSSLDDPACLIEEFVEILSLHLFCELVIGHDLEVVLRLLLHPFSSLLLSLHEAALVV